MELTPYENNVYKALLRGIRGGKNIEAATGIDIATVNQVILRLQKYGLLITKGSGRSRTIMLIGEEARKPQEIPEKILGRPARPVTIYHLDTNAYLMEKYGCLNPDPVVRDKLEGVNFYTTGHQRRQRRVRV